MDRVGADALQFPAMVFAVEEAFDRAGAYEIRLIGLLA